MHELKDNINTIFCDSYFSQDDGLGERLEVFVRPNLIAKRLKENKAIVCAETGFGTGLSLAACIYDCSSLSGSIDWYSVEAHPIRPETMDVLLSAFEPIKQIKDVLVKVWQDIFSKLKPGWNDLAIMLTNTELKLSLHLFFGDVIQFLEQLAEKLKQSNSGKTYVDAWFFDGHNPQVNPAMWTSEVFSKAAETSKVGHTSFASYSAAGSVKQALRNAGFLVHRKKGFARKHHRICGYYGSHP